MSHNLQILSMINIQDIEKVTAISKEQIESVSGLFLADDSSDPTSSVLNAQADLSDGDIETATSATLTGTYSVGLDLSTAKTITKIRLYDNGATTNSGIYTFGSNDALDVYTSSDNSTWTLLASFKPVVREIFLTPDDYPSPPPSPLPSPLPFPEITDNIYIIDLIFETPPTTRYIKAFAIDGALQDVEAVDLALTEMEAFTRADPSEQDSRIIDTVKVISEVTTTPIVRAGDGVNDIEVIFNTTLQKRLR